MLVTSPCVSVNSWDAVTIVSYYRIIVPVCMEALATVRHAHNGGAVALLVYYSTSMATASASFSVLGNSHSHSHSADPG